MEVKIYQTTDYDIFVCLKGNRVVKANKQLSESMCKKNLIDYRPIIVDESMHVIDGQHRLEAAKEAGLPVSYVILPKDVCPAEEAMLMLNINQKGWKLPDYVHHWAAEGKKEYIELEKFTINSHFPASSIYRFFGRIELSGSVLRAGAHFEVNPKAYEILNFLKSEESLSTGLARTRDFCAAVNIVFKEWRPYKIAQLKENMYRVKKAADVKEYLLEFKRVTRKIRSDKK